MRTTTKHGADGDVLGVRREVLHVFREIRTPAGGRELPYVPGGGTGTD